MSRERLAKLLGMLGSEFDGERANAARMIADMAKKEGKGIADFVMSAQVVEKIVYRDREPEWRDPSHDDHLNNFRKAQEEWVKANTEGSRYTAKEDFDRAYWTKKRREGPVSLIAGLRHAQDFPEHLNGFEHEFIEDALRKYRYDYELSPKQTKVARRIIAKVAAYEGDPLV